MVVDVSCKPPSDESYLGDGLYASFDGYNIWLRAGTNRVALEPSVHTAFQEWYKRLQAAYKERGYSI